MNTSVADLTALYTALHSQAVALSNSTTYLYKKDNTVFPAIVAASVPTIKYTHNTLAMRQAGLNEFFYIRTAAIIGEVTAT